MDDLGKAEKRMKRRSLFGSKSRPNPWALLGVAVVALLMYLYFDYFLLN